MAGLVALAGLVARRLQPGDHIVIHGAPPRMSDRFSIRADDVVMPDGWTRHLFRDSTTNKYREATPPSN